MECELRKTYLGFQQAMTTYQISARRKADLDEIRQWMIPELKKELLKSRFPDADVGRGFMDDAYGDETILLTDLGSRIAYLEQRLQELRSLERNRPADDPEPYDYEKLVRGFNRKICELKQLQAMYKDAGTRSHLTDKKRGQLTLFETFPESDEE